MAGSNDNRKARKADPEEAIATTSGFRSEATDVAKAQSEILNSGSQKDIGRSEKNWLDKLRQSGY